MPLETIAPPSAERTEQRTAETRERIRRKSEEDVVLHSCLGNESINRRIEELEKEWDIERALETNAAGFVLLGMFMGAARSRVWYLLPLAAGGFLLRHALRGWSAPAEALRRMGMRTRAEISDELFALKALRGDFSQISGLEGDSRQKAREAFRAAER